ncbi:MAG: GNAT family N-acetyltransferase [Pseudomonadota bacterium]
MSDNSPTNVSLRRYRADDADRLTALLNDPDVTGMTSTIPFPYARSDAEAFLSKVSAEQGREVSRAIIFGDDTLVGGIGLGPRQLGDNELGYWIGKAHWGHGIATEAVRQFIALLTKLKVNGPLEAQTVASNLASQRVLEKNGFQFKGEGECLTPARSTNKVPSKLYLLER